MPVDMPVDTAAITCEVRPFKGTLHADREKKARINLPDGVILRTCNSAREGSQVITLPGSGGTTACVFYAYEVDGKKPEVQLVPRKTAVSKSLADKSCPAIDHSAQGFPGKDWFFLSDNLPLDNAYRVKARVESAGLAFLNAEKKQLKNAASVPDLGTAQLGMQSLSVAPPPACRTKQGFFQERYAACYKAVVYNDKLRGVVLHVGLRKNGEYKFIESSIGGK